MEQIIQDMEAGKEIEKAYYVPERVYTQENAVSYTHLDVYKRQELKSQMGPAGIAMIDLDDFKLYNDTYGHNAGDMALTVVAETICKHIRKDDILIRYGGDEMCIRDSYGLIFGDIILEQFAGLLAKRFQEDGLNGGIYIRAGADQMLVWLPVCTTGPIVRSVQGLEKEFGALTDEKHLSLSLKCGIAVKGSRNSLSEALEQTKTCLLYTSRCV